MSGSNPSTCVQPLVGTPGTLLRDRWALQQVKPERGSWGKALSNSSFTRILDKMSFEPYLFMFIYTGHTETRIARQVHPAPGL